MSAGQACSGQKGNKISRGHRLQERMPWKESNAMSERIRLINDYLRGEYAISELAVEYQVSRKTVYKSLAKTA